MSQSETEGSASPSEADETDEDHIRPAGLRPRGDLDGNAVSSHRSRVSSLDPSRSSREDARTHANSLPVPGHSSHERDPSPLGRAISVLSQNSHGEGHGHGHHLFHRRPKIPKPTSEQVAYIKKVLVDIPGPVSANAPPAGLRVARPPGSRPSSSGTDAGATSDSVSSTASALTQLNIGSATAAPTVSWQDTDLFECFRQFTSVEVLEGENSFACQNCWKWLNPELEAKRKADKARRRAERIERRRVRRAIRRGEDPHAAAAPDGNDLTSDDERDPAADRTARNTPSHSPRLGSTFTPLSTVPPIEPLGASAVVAPTLVAEPAPLTNGSDEAHAPANGTPMRHLSVSSVATSASQAPTVSTDYEGGVSSEVFETTTDEGEGDDGFDEADDSEPSPGLDDGASLSGSLSALPASRSNDPKQGKPIDRTISEAVSESLQAQIKPLPPPSQGPVKVAGKATNGHAVPSKPPPRKQRHILRRAHKRYLISPADLPPVLVVHLKRFMQTSKSSLFGSAFVNLKKRDDPVSFPKEMDLTPFLAPSGKPPRLNPNAFGSTASSMIDEDARMRASAHSGHKVELEKEVHNARYRLYAAVVHFGDLNTGASHWHGRLLLMREDLTPRLWLVQVTMRPTSCRTGTARARTPVVASAAGCSAPMRTLRLSARLKSCARGPTCCALSLFVGPPCGTTLSRALY